MGPIQGQDRFLMDINEIFIGYLEISILDQNIEDILYIFLPIYAQVGFNNNSNLK